MNLIAFTGPKQVGKSTAAAVVSKLVEYPCKISFAGPLKMALLAMGFTRDELFLDKEAGIPDVGCSGRFLMQTLGTQWGRDTIHPNLWLIMFTRQIRLQEKNNTDLVIVDDVRYDNEASHILSLGGTIINLTSTNRCNYAPDSHSSERGISPELITHTVVNDGDLDQFVSDIKLLVIPILKTK